MRAWIARHKRALIATATAAVMAVQGIAADTHVAWYAQAAVSVLYAVSVYLVPDVGGEALWVKPTVAALLAGAQAAVLAADGGITVAEIWTIALAGIGALGILAVPNTPPVNLMGRISPRR